MTGRLRAVDERIEQATATTDNGKLLLIEEEWAAWMKEKKSGEASSRWQWQASRQGFFGEEEEGRPQRLPVLREDRPLGKGVPKSQVGEEG